MRTWADISAEKKRGFTLVEIIVVLAVVLILMSLAAPIVRSIMQSSRVSEAGNMVSETFEVARGLAELENREIEVRFFKYEDPDRPGDPAAFYAFQLFAYNVIVDPADPDYDPALELPGFMPEAQELEPIQRLPEGIVFFENESSLLTEASRQILGTAPITMPDGTAAEVVGFRFRPSGTTDLSLRQPTEGWFVTVVTQNDLLASSGALPPDFATIQIDAFTGTHRTLQPN